jgi:hypothetical protein
MMMDLLLMGVENLHEAFSSGWFCCERRTYDITHGLFAILDQSSLLLGTPEIKRVGRMARDDSK